MEKVQWNSINKKNGLKQLKNEKSSPLPRVIVTYNDIIFHLKIAKVVWKTRKSLPVILQLNYKNKYLWNENWSKIKRAK